MEHRILTLTLRRAVLFAAAVLIALTAFVAATHHVAAPSAPHAASPPAWPSAATTGVPVGIALKPSRGMTITTKGAVVSGLDIHGCVEVHANNVTLKDSRLTGGQCAFAQITIDVRVSGTLIEDTEIDGQNRSEVPNDGSGICCGGFTALRLNIHGNVDGAIAGGAFATTVQDSWIHDLYHASTSHNQDILSNGGTAGIVIRHNRFDNQLSEVGTVDLFGDFAAVQNVTIDDNLLNGGGFTVYGGCEPTKTYGNQCQNIAFTNNHFMRSPEPGAFYSHGGFYGTVTSFNGKKVGDQGDDLLYRAAHNLRWSDNVWDDTNTPIDP
jgi:hypothetical protein